MKQGNKKLSKVITYVVDGIPYSISRKGVLRLMGLNDGYTIRLNGMFDGTFCSLQMRTFRNVLIVVEKVRKDSTITVLDFSKAMVVATYLTTVYGDADVRYNSLPQHPTPF